MKVLMIATKGSRAGTVFETSRRNARVLLAIGRASIAPDLARDPSQGPVSEPQLPLGDANSIRTTPALKQPAPVAGDSATEDAMRADLAKTTNPKLRELAAAEQTEVADDDKKADLVDKIVKGRYLRRDMRAQD